MAWNVRVCRMGASAALLIIMVGASWAGTWDFNPDKYAIKHKYEAQSDMEGEGYFMERRDVNTNNLSLREYMHGSGTFDVADLVSSEQKSTGYSYYYIIDNDKASRTYGKLIKKSTWANSVISFTKQSEMNQSPAEFVYGTGWYSSHPVSYNSLLKDKTVAKSYQEATMMHHQLEYARGFKGDIAVEMNCTGPTEKADGKGSISMRLEDQVTRGTVQVGELQTDNLYNTRSAMKRQGSREPLIDVDAYYVGSFHLQKNMKIDASKSRTYGMEEWLPCCHGGFFDIEDWDKGRNGEAPIFDCSCRDASISTFKPKWNATQAQFLSK